MHAIRILALAIASVPAALAAPAAAGNLSVRVVDSGGRPVADAVVTLQPAAGPAPPMRNTNAYRVVQQDTQFHPFVSIVPVGATVAFPNLDPFRHHVYSFSKAKRFELKLFAKDQSRSITFDHAGIVAVGCNIHDGMSAYIFVSDTVWTTRSGANGAVMFRDTPAGAYTIQVWHPYLRAPGGVTTRAGKAGPDRVETFQVALRPPMKAMDGY